jgi:hypothetical protein
MHMRTEEHAVVGHKLWAIAEGYIPGKSTGNSPEFTSHETACLLNTSGRDAHIRITVFYSDSEPVGPYTLTVPARRTVHLRFNKLTGHEPIPRDTDYASLIESDIPVVMQHTLLDIRQSANALLSTVAFGAE